MKTLMRVRHVVPYLLFTLPPPRGVPRCAQPGFPVSVGVIGLIGILSRLRIVITRTSFDLHKKYQKPGIGFVSIIQKIVLYWRRAFQRTLDRPDK